MFSEPNCRCGVGVAELRIRGAQGYQQGVCDLACMWSFGPSAVVGSRYGGRDHDDPSTTTFRIGQSGGAERGTWAGNLGGAFLTASECLCTR